MSIIKNSAAEGDYHYRIAKFGTHGEVPYTDVNGNILYRDGQGGRGSLYANTYCEYDTSSEYFTTHGFIGPKCALIIEVYLPDDDTNAVIAVTNSQLASIAITATGGQIMYFYGAASAPAATHSFTPGWHIIGFLPSGDGVKAVYDAQMFGSVLTGVTGRSKMEIGHIQGSPSGMRISKVCTSEYLTMSSTMRYTHHYYPVTYEQPALEDETPVANLTCHWYEARVLQGIPTGEVEEGIASGTAAPHGVTIYDLQEATGSPFRDLMAIWASDDTPEALDDDADAADILTKTTEGTTETRKFAFSIANIDFDDEDEPRVPIPLPEGWTLADRGDSDKFTYPAWGELICGRQPKWDMWNDSTKRFTSVEWDTYGEFGQHTNLAIRLNIQCERFFYSGNNKVKLEDFIGYSSDRSKSFRPKFELLDGGFTSERHNKVECRCDETTLIPNYSTSGVTVNDQNHIYTYADGTIGRAKCAIGNLANWDKTIEELSELDDRDVPGVFSDGMAVAIYADITVGNVTYPNAVLAIAKCMGDEIFSTEYLEDGMEDALTLFREGKENGEDKILSFELNTQTFGGKTVREILSSQTITNAKAGLMLVNAKGGHTPRTGADMIFAHRIIPSKPTNIGFNDDPMMVTGSTNYRCILRTPSVQINGTTYHIYPVWTADGGRRQTMLSRTDSYNMIDFNFTLIEDGDQTPTDCKLWSDDDKDMYVKIKLSGIDNGEPYSYTFTTQGTQASQDGGDTLKVGLYLHEGNLPTPSITDRTAIQNTVFPNGEKYIYDRSSAERYLWCSRYLLYGNGANLQRYCQHTDSPSSTIVPIPENTTCEIWISPTPFT